MEHPILHEVNLELHQKTLNAAAIVLKLLQILPQVFPLEIDVALLTQDCQETMPVAFVVRFHSPFEGAAIHQRSYLLNNLARKGQGWDATGVLLNQRETQPPRVELSSGKCFETEVERRSHNVGSHRERLLCLVREVSELKVEVRRPLQHVEKTKALVHFEKLHGPDELPNEAPRAWRSLHGRQTDSPCAPRVLPLEAKLDRKTHKLDPTLHQLLQ
mmetsp:Transcript_17295/g.46892  ORF Transcript_17295/g.46892 Transcript_17295/m.46892 type:complete len:216 (+) Transcript_17295:1446-2093(+)